jgi:hypothetical protein
MMPRLGEKYEIEIEVISKPREEYNSDEYLELKLPVAPAVMVGNETVVEGSDVKEERLEAVICRHLGLPPPESEKKGVLGWLQRREFYQGVQLKESLCGALNDYVQLYKIEPDGHAKYIKSFCQILKYLRQ